MILSIDLKKYPALRLILTAGFSFAISLFTDIFWSAIFSFLMIGIISFLSKRTSDILYYLLGFSLGILISINVENVVIESPNKIIQDFPAIIEGKVVSIIKSSDKYQRLIVEGKIDTKQLPTMTNQRIILTVTGLNYKNIRFNTGDKIFAECFANTPKRKYIETDFPEDKYCASLDVKWVAYSNSRNVAFIGTEVGLLSIKDRQTSMMINKIEKIFSTSSYPIVTALLLGDKTSIDFKTKRLFSLTGTAHVLAVSGLHVTLIATIIFFLLGFLKSKWLKFIIFSSLIITYIFITGMQASAIRAGLMAILYIFSTMSQRKSSAINIITLTIILVVCIFPEMLYSAGFHLSIAAIIGIALLFRPINNFFTQFLTSNNAILKYFISSISISLASSIVVSPIVAYYFEVYSLVSPLTNLFVIPMMTLSMIFSIIALALSYVYTPLSEIYAGATNSLIELSLSLNNFALDLPYAYLQSKELIFLSLLISVAMLYLLYSKKLNQFFFRFTIVLCVLLAYFNIETKDEEKLSIIPRHQFVALELNDSKNFKTFLIFDRKPSQRPRTDFAFENYLAQSSDLKIYYSGNAGLNLVDRMKKSIHIKSCAMDLKFQKNIAKKINIKQIIQQIIDLKDLKNV